MRAELAPGMPMWDRTRAFHHAAILDLLERSEEVSILKIAGVDFPEPLLNALQSKRLVVFAGAGVSMGPPAGLPSFRRLAEQVAEGTGQSIGTAETEDRFLGRLEDRGTDVHQRAVEILQRNNPEPTALHLDLLRFFGDAEDVRTVTTNFDDLFEQAALVQLNSLPRVFQAPALPLGNRFGGIVHLHGSVSEPTDMVLTHRDFGRAYLTESDGWARRFLIGLFANYTVLFVGYSHTDTIMNYLTPSLPPDDGQQRFALVGDLSDDPDHWYRLGVEPVTFPQTDTDDFSCLHMAVAGLADFLRRGVLDWQQRIQSIAGGYPPIDDESTGTIEHALTDPVMTRFFVEAAELPEWVEWLARRGYLTNLFDGGELGERDRRLVWWLVSRFAMNHDGTLFALIASHGNRLNPTLWKELCWQMQDSIKASPDPAVVTRWVLCLASVIPTEADDAALAWLGEASASVGATDCLLRVFEAMTAPLVHAPPHLGWRDSGMFHHYMQELLSEHIKPNLPEMAEPLLALTTMRLNTRHAVLTAWEEGDTTWHWDNFGRSAIEAHEQDNMGGEVDPLIDTARRCLEWLAVNQADVARIWSERHCASPAPLLRRLAVHTLSFRTDLSADDKIAWLLEHCDVNDIAAHHEMFRALAQVYPLVGSQQREALIQAISEYQAPDIREGENWDANRLAAHHRFTWFHWLHEADPDCSIAKAMLETVWTEHPDFRPSEHPDFTHYHWSGMQSRDQSPWNVDALLARPASEALPDLLAYQPTEREMFEGHDRWSMLSAVEEAARSNSSWGLALADSLVTFGEWHSDLWYRLIVAWANTELDQGSVKRVLAHLSADELHRQHPREIASVLTEIAREASASEAADLPDVAKSIAIALRQYAVSVEVPNLTASVGGVPQEVDWLARAINHPSGKLAEFWLQSLAQWHRRQRKETQSLNDEYRKALDDIMQDDSAAGHLGRTILARHFPFLAYVDETWARQNLIPLLEPGHNEFASAWDGLTYCGQMTPQTAELLRGPFLEAAKHLNGELTGTRQERFVTKYIGMLTWFTSSHDDEWIINLFNHGDSSVKHQFATEIGRHLRSLGEVSQKEWWSIWLKGYWENRLLGVPTQLDDTEIETMLEWTALLPAVYPEAVDLAVRMPVVPLRRSMAIRRTGISEMIQQHPDAVARLLIHLGRTDRQPWIWYEATEIVDDLLQSNLDGEIQASLRETAARMGLR